MELKKERKRIDIRVDSYISIKINDKSEKDDS